MEFARSVSLSAETVGKLPAHYREAFLLRVVCGWSFEALSRQMRVSERMGKVYVARALMYIQHRLDVEAAPG